MIEIIICESCKGSGLRTSTDYDDSISYYLCEDCKGTGQQIKETIYRNVTDEDLKQIAREIRS